MSQKKRQAARERHEFLAQQRKALRVQEQVKEVEKVAKAVTALKACKPSPNPYANFQGVTIKRKVLNEDFTKTLNNVFGLGLYFVRKPGDLVLKYNSQTAVLYHLLRHLFAKYPITSAFDTLFTLSDRNQHEAFPRIAQGGSVYQIVSPWFPLTKKMAHILSVSSSGPIIHAIRRAQVLALGGDAVQVNRVNSTLLGRRLFTYSQEEFWTTVIHWFVRNPMIAADQVAPLVDYLHQKHQEEPTYSMAGRSANRLLFDMGEWHNNLTKTQKIEKAEYTPTGKGVFCYGENRRYKDPNTKNTMVYKHEWVVREILTDKELYQEGRDLRHCVFSYKYQIKQGRAAVWSLQEKGLMANWERLVTIEVDPRYKNIVQIRGKMNRAPTQGEMRIIGMWQQQEGLTLSTARFF